MSRKTGRPRPLIGITPDVEGLRAGAPPDRAAGMLQLHKRYAQAILEAGGLPLILPIAGERDAIDELVGRLEGVVVSGGNFDIDPAHYGEARGAALGALKEERTGFELDVIARALRRNLPLLGICGGAQAINVALGGTLYQDIPSQFPAALEHQRGAAKDRGGHAVRVHGGTLLARIVGRDRLETNTTHHQAVKRLGRGLIVNATAEDGVIEGLESTHHAFVLGLQWHPEWLIDRDPGHKKIFTAFISACALRRP